MKKRVHKNQIVITTLAVLIAVAGYVTYDKKGADIKDAETVASVSSLAFQGGGDSIAGRKPFKIMGDYLRQQPRDIVYNLCQYGMGDVWKWGDAVGGQCWRTTNDITDTWESVKGIALSQDRAAAWSETR